MNADKRVKYLVLVPLRMNDGPEVDQQIILDFLDTLFVNFEGYTIGGTVQSAYKMADGKKAIDETTEYWIVCRKEQYPLLVQLVAELGGKLGQESMFLEETGSTVEFVPPVVPDAPGDKL